MTTVKAFRYDGNSSNRAPVNLAFTATGVLITGDDLLLQFAYKDVMLQPKLAGVVTQLRFADGSQCDIENQPGLEAALDLIPGHAANRFIHKLENNLVYIVLAVVLSIAVLAGLIQYGVPVMAREVAFRMPPSIENDMGRESLRFFDHIMQPSMLGADRQSELRHKFQLLAEQVNVAVQDIQFRQGNEIGANAFALPSGIVIFTDEIVALSKDDRELIAVFAHELGHVKYRHTMRHVLQNSVTGLMIVLITGDIGTASSLAAALPTMLVQTKFSRDFETEADDFAITLLAQNGIPASYLGDILHRMADKAGENDVPGFLSTHPDTDMRVMKFNGVKHD